MTFHIYSRLKFKKIQWCLKIPTSSTIALKNNLVCTTYIGFSHSAVFWNWEKVASNEFCTKCNPVWCVVSQKESKAVYKSLAPKQWKTETIISTCYWSSVAVICNFIRNLALLSKSFEKSFNGASTNLLILLEVHFLLPSEVQSLPQKRG